LVTEEASRSPALLYNLFVEAEQSRAGQEGSEQLIEWKVHDARTIG
jgi:hypothetical protein